MLHIDMAEEEESHTPKVPYYSQNEESHTPKVPYYSQNEESHTPKFPRFFENEKNIMEDIDMGALKLNNNKKNSNKKNNKKNNTFKLSSIKKNKNNNITMKRKGPKSIKFKTAKNRMNAAKKVAKAKTAKKIKEKRFKAIRIYSRGVEGIDELVQKLERTEEIYDAANSEKQSDISVYTSILTSSIQKSLDDNLQDYFKKYKDVYNAELSQENPMEYISILIPFLRKLVKVYKDSKNNTNSADYIFEIQIDSILNAATTAGAEYDSIGKNKKDEALDALSDIFGTMGV